MMPNVCTYPHLVSFFCFFFISFFMLSLCSMIIPLLPILYFSCPFLPLLVAVFSFIILSSLCFRSYAFYLLSSLLYLVPHLLYPLLTSTFLLLSPFLFCFFLLSSYLSPFFIMYASNMTTPAKHHLCLLRKTALSQKPHLMGKSSVMLATTKKFLKIEVTRFEKQSFVNIDTRIF